MKRTTLLAYFGSIVVCAGVAALAPLSGGDFDLSWHTIDGGGGTSTGGGFELAGTIGQHDAGQTMTGGNFTVTGGFWAGLSAATNEMTTTPFAFDAFRGFLNSGTLDDVLAADDVDLCHDLGITIFPSEAPITLDFDGTLPTDSPASLDVTFESSANTPGLELTISFWNYNTNSWEVVGTAAQGFNVDVVRTFPGVPADHVEVGTGNVRTRYEVRQAGIIFQFPWTDCIDHVFWTTVG